MLRTVAVMLDVPKTLYGLECVRSDFLMLRVSQAVITRLEKCLSIEMAERA